MFGKQQLKKELSQNEVVAFVQDKRRLLTTVCRQSDLKLQRFGTPQRMARVTPDQ
jgi:hypothetical protein